MSDRIHPASFRDPSGFVFSRGGLVHRQVNRSFASEYEQLMGSGLYDALVSRGFLLPHQAVDPTGAESEEHFQTLLPEQLEFVSYPYEWSFSQLKDAALLTLRIQREALAFDMTLRDASAYNVQYQRGRPVFIDTLSFGHYCDGEPWAGYRQFCQHFLAPLALMSLRDVRLQKLLVAHVDGIPLDLATALLPGRTRLRMGLYLHLYLHARYQRRYEGRGAGEGRTVAARKLSRAAHTNLIRALEGTVRKLEWKPHGTEWAEYYAGDSYEDRALEHKKTLVGKFLSAISPQCVWDLGANTGVYSRIAADLGARVCSFDVDPACVERNYRQVRSEREELVLPLLLDLVSPSPGIGWANRERSPLSDRGHADALLALALIHHLAISNNVPLKEISRYFSQLAEHLVIEFVPKDDAKVRVLLTTREDIFPDYTREGFEAAFREHWEIVEAVEIEGSERILYRLHRLEDRAPPGR